MSAPTEEEEVREHAAAFVRKVHEQRQLARWLVCLCAVGLVIALWLALR